MDEDEPTSAREGEPAADDWRSKIAREGANVPAEPAAPRRRSQEVGRGREATRPQDLPMRGWRDILWRVAKAVPEDRVLSTAGSVAFFALLAIFPGLATLIALYGLFADPVALGEHLRLLAGVLPADALTLVGDEMTRIVGQGAGTLSLAFLISLIVSLWSASSGVSALFDALNVVYKEREKRSFLRFYAMVLLFTLGAVGFALAAIAAVVAVPIVLNLFGLGRWSETLLAVMRWPLLLALVGFSLAVLYRYGPSRRQAQWQWVSWGSGVAAVLWIATSMLFSYYVASFDSYNRVYGSLGAGVGFMTWIWLSVVIVLLGGELNAEMEHQTARDTTAGAPPDKPIGTRNAVMADTVGAASSGAAPSR